MSDLNKTSPGFTISSSPLWRRVKAAVQRHPNNRYQAFREILRVMLPYSLRRRSVQAARSRFGLRTFGNWLHRQAPAAVETGVATRSPIAPRDFYEAVTLLPHIPPTEVAAILDKPLSAAPMRKPDILCFSIVDWSFRFQRPQQIMQQFAASGHRVFYVNVTEFLSGHASPKFTARPIERAWRQAPDALEELYEIKLATGRPLELYRTVVTDRQANHIAAALDELRREFNINDAIGYVMFPSWEPVARAVQERWGWHVIYDCMDEWENFPGVDPGALAAEKELVRRCNLLVVTAQRLFDKWRPYNRPTVLARNGADYDFFAGRCQPNDLLSDAVHPVIGYYGAIADWFDVQLLAETARLRPHYTFVLLGGVFEANVAPLQELANVRLRGQQPYETMPQYLYHFDVCIIPFKINAITEATDPVKLYEYLSGGKPVISVPLPELEPYRDSVYLADNATEFAAALDRAIAEDTAEKAEARRAVARQHTWQERYSAIARAIHADTPRASIIIITYNNLALTKLCVESLLRNTEYPNYEIILVDNQSADETPAYLKSLAARYDHISILLNDKNHGFAKANNQGIAISTGDFLVLLNNDTIVPPGWLTRLLAHAGDPQVGLVGPMTNFAGNEARIEVKYRTWAEMQDFARRHVWQHENLIADIHMLAMFCVAMRREVFERIGPLDEQFGIGMFEDDDYSMRVKAAGLRVVCAADAFVHHFGQAAFGKLIQSGQYNHIFDENRQRYEAKWGIIWTPHVHAKLEYQSHTKT